MFRFVVDRIVSDQPYPALQQYTAEPYTQSWRKFGQHTPYTVPVELINHCREHGYPIELITTQEYITNSNNSNTNIYYYPVQWGFFSFDIDYIQLLPLEIKRVVGNDATNLQVLFLYHEGDNPERIKTRLDSLCLKNGLTTNVYRLVTGNTSAELLENSVYFNDHELLYLKRNKDVVAQEPKLLKTIGPQRKSFLLLSRSHKWWRAAVLTLLQRQGILDRAVWSYNTDILVGDCIEDCPVELESLAISQDELAAFLQSGPYTCDTQTAEQHNDHSLHVQEHYDKTACSIVLETLFDADQSGGTFLTEKTFKCLKHAHPFVVFAPAGSLQALRSQGYRTFDSVIDNSYDTIENNTQRFLAVIECISKLAQANPNDLYNRCLDDIQHNQQVFLTSKYNRLNSLSERLNNESNSK